MLRGLLAFLVGADVVWLLHIPVKRIQLGDQGVSSIRCWREEGGVPAFGRLMHGNHRILIAGDATPTLRGACGSRGGRCSSLDDPRGHNIYATIHAVAPGGPGSTLHGITHIHLAGNVRIASCVPNVNRGLRRRSIILVHNNHIGSLPNIHCRVVHNALSARNITNHGRTHSGCNTGHPGTNTTGGWLEAATVGNFPLCGWRIHVIQEMAICMESTLYSAAKILLLSDASSVVL